jgi:2-polyprenyl-3-methyl-5-hydroxy-6-metoxy-1,4-benzoquinol methylase
MAAGGYVTYADNRFTLPASHVPVLAADDTPVSGTGMLAWVLAVAPRIDDIVTSMRTGSGVPMSSYGPEFVRAMDRFSAPMYANSLVGSWLPELPELDGKLRSGAKVADVGCGAGRAIVELAKAYPKSRFVGFDSSADQLDRARAHAAAAGVADRVAFRLGDVRTASADTFDVVTTFDVVHDSGDPLRLVRAVRSMLGENGIYLCVEPTSAPALEDNLNPLGATFYAVSLMYCLQVAVAEGGEGLGTLGLPAPTLEELCRRAGFRTVTQIPIADPMNSFYLVRP